MPSLIPDEQPPLELENRLKDYLSRMFRQARLSDNISDQFPVLTAIPLKPIIGKLYYFKPIAGTEIIYEGFYWYDETYNIWRHLGMSDFMLDISRGIVPNMSHINKFGVSQSVTNGVEEVIWSNGGAYTFSTTADITHIVSSVAETQEIEIQGLDANWDEVIQTKTLTGTTGVALDTPLIRVYRMRVNSATINAGDVQCGVGAVTSAFTTTNLRAEILPGRGQTLLAIYTVPAGKTAYLTKYYASIIGSAAPPAKEPAYVAFRLWTIDNANGYAPRIGHAIGGVLSGTSIIEHEFEPYPSAGEKTDVYLTAQPDGDDAYVSGGFDIVLVDVAP